MTLEQVNIWVHTSGSSRSHRTTCHTFRCFCRTGIVNRMIFDILRQIFSTIQTLFQFGVSDITTTIIVPFNDRRVATGYLVSSFKISGIGRFRSILTTSPSPALRNSAGNQFAGFESSFSIQIPSLLILHLILRSAEQRNAQTYRTRSTVTGQTDDTHIVVKYLPPNCAPRPILCASANTSFPVQYHGTHGLYSFPVVGKLS